MRAPPVRPRLPRAGREASSRARHAASTGRRGGRSISVPAVEMIGTVKWYNPDKGFGFITPESGGKDVFIHATVLERAGLGPLAEGQSVRMGVVQGAKGPEAGTISLP